MGTGRSGLSKGIKSTSSKSTKGGLRERARSTGYELLMSEDKLNQYESSMKVYLDALSNFQKAMRETDEIIQAAGGTIDIVKLKSGVGGNADDSGHINLNELYVNDTKTMLDTLPHEHTHNLVHSLITKELGFKQGTYEFHAAYSDAIIEHSINTEALDKYKRYMSRVYDREIADAHKLLSNPAISGEGSLRPIAEHMLDRARQGKAKLANLTIAQASRQSGMRSYATRQYSWAPEGHYIEMPTVAAEMFQKHGYSFKTLLKESPYSYFVMQSLYSRLHKDDYKKKKKK
jgi:hypothetical protein